MPKVIPEYREEAKKKIIAAGLEVMSNKGYNDTTLDDIANHVGVSKTTLYLYFKNKEELIVEIIRNVHENIQTKADVIFRNESDLDGYTHLLDLFLEYDMNRIGLNFDILALAARNETIRKIYEEHMNRVIEQATRGIIYSQKNGEIRMDMDAKTIAVSMIFLMTGVTNLLLKGMNKEEIRKRYYDIGKIILGFNK
jgi:AcrR family transcriptional regulator